MNPSIGRIIHVFLENSQIRPAIITRVGPARVDEEDTGQVAYELFLAPEDYESGMTRGAVLRRYPGQRVRVGHERVAGEAWKPGDWIWPPRI